MGSTVNFYKGGRELAEVVFLPGESSCPGRRGREGRHERKRWG